MTRRRVPVLAILEASYRVEQSRSEWLGGVIAATTPVLDDGLGVCGFFVDLRDGGYKASGYQGTGMIGSATGRALFATWNKNVPTEAKRYLTLQESAGTTSSFTHRMRARRDAPADLGRLQTVHGFPDLQGVNAIDTELLGCGLAAPLSARSSRREPRVWARVASHLCAGARLLRRLPGNSIKLLEGAEAVIAPGGRIVHAEGEARDWIARAALRDAALQIDHARTRRAQLSAEEFTQAWQALYHGRWTVLDSFDHDGRRYFVAWPNEPMLKQCHSLSVREAQVARGAALGHSNKLIAYELGLATSTVSTLLARAIRKLRLHSRRSLIQRIAMELELPLESGHAALAARK
jgi:DNA-binding CsgD family transcriptional regulator